MLAHHPAIGEHDLALARRQVGIEEGPHGTVVIGQAEVLALRLLGGRETEAARNGPLRAFDRFAHFSDGWIARAPGDATVLGDMRYSLSAQAFDPIWGIRFTAPDAPVEVEWVNRSRDRRAALGELWAEINGANPAFRPLPAQAVPRRS